MRAVRLGAAPALSFLDAAERDSLVGVAGLASGMNTIRSSWKSLAPSIRAASSKEAGTASK
jgi:hypothetical protein